MFGSAMFKFQNHSIYGMRWNIFRHDSQNVLTGIHATLAVIAFLQLVLAIIHSAYCCAESCCVSHSGGVVVSCLC